jgi:ankyrin repeat protein
VIPIRPTILGLSLVAVALVPSCKERGEAKRESLSEAGYEVSQEAYFRAAESDDIRALKAMIESGVALESMDVKGRTALHAAAGSGAMQSINFMLDRKMDVDVMDSDGRTPLMEAVLRSTPETVRYLLRQGANPSLKDHEKFKPLMLAVRDGRKNMVPELAPYVREDLDDALLAAAILGQAGVIDELTNFGASIYARIDDGRTPLMLAAQNGHASAVEILLEIGANRFAVDKEGRTADKLAAESGHDLLASRLSEEPKEGDFELSEAAELGAEMAAEIAEHSLDPQEEGSELVANVDSAEVISEDGGAMSDASSSVAGGDEVVVNEGLSSEPGAVAAAGDSGGAVTGGTKPWNAPIPGQGSGAIGMMPSQPLREAPAQLEGAVLQATKLEVKSDPHSAGAVAYAREEPAAPIVMRTYRQRELPLMVKSADKGVAEIRMAGSETQKFGEGSSIPGTSLKVIRVHRKMQSGKENAGRPVEVSVVEVKDTNTGVSRDLVADLPALAHDPVALVEDTASGRYYVARAGQRFQTADGTDYLVGDVRPNQVVIENMQSHETITIPLRGPRG